MAALFHDLNGQSMEIQAKDDSALAFGQPACPAGGVVARPSPAGVAAHPFSGDYLASMSHEIRTPMSTIIGMSELALRTVLDDQQRGYIDKVHRAAVSLLGVINDMLDHARIDAGELVLDRVPFSLATVAQDLGHALRPLAEERGLKLGLQQAPELVANLLGDPLRLGRLLLHVGHQAIHDAEGGTVALRIDRIAEADGEVQLHFRVHSRPQAALLEVSGPGIGLCAGLVALMRGSLWAETDADGGCTVHIKAWFGLAEPAPAQQPATEVQEMRDVPVLLVEDNAEALQVLWETARGFGLQVDTATDGWQALALIEHAASTGRPYKLVLTDWRMPGMDAGHCMAELRRRGVPQPPVVVVSGLQRHEVLTAAAERGVQLCAVIGKPYSASAVFEVVVAALGGDDWVVPGEQVELDHEQMALRQLSGRRVLLIEDNDLNTELVTEFLADVDVEVVRAANGKLALELLARDARFDAVLMDCHMPVMDGFEATRRIRSEPALAHLPIIAMTADTQAADRLRVAEAGMNDHVSKPIDTRELFATLARWIGPRDEPAVAG